MKKGLIGKKIGMTQIFDEAGNVIPVTVVEAGPCTVTQIKTVENDGYQAVQVGFGGTVTCNYDGKNKMRCKVGDGAFIGCNTNLIAPVEVGEKAYIAAGSTITDNIPEDALAIARARQVIKENWVNIKKPYKEKK